MGQTPRAGGAADGVRGGRVGHGAGAPGQSCRWALRAEGRGDPRSPPHTPRPGLPASPRLFLRTCRRGLGHRSVLTLQIRKRTQSSPAPPHVRRTAGAQVPPSEPSAPQGQAWGQRAGRATPSPCGTRPGPCTSATIARAACPGLPAGPGTRHPERRHLSAAQLTPALLRPTCQRPSDPPWKTPRFGGCSLHGLTAYCLGLGPDVPINPCRTFVTVSSLGDVNNRMRSQ